MGQEILAHCKKCKYKTIVSYGGNMMNFKTYNPVPAINTLTNEIESINDFEHYKNPQYKFYTKDELKGECQYTINNCFQKLNIDNNLCPKCNNFSLSFTEIARTD